MLSSFPFEGRVASRRTVLRSSVKWAAAVSAAAEQKYLRLRKWIAAGDLGIVHHHQRHNLQIFRLGSAAADVFCFPSVDLLVGWIPRGCLFSGTIESLMRYDYGVIS